MTSDAIQLIEALRTNPRSRPHVVARFRSLRAQDPRSAAAAELLDQLAASGVHDNTCMETLLELLFEHGLARPAIRKLLINADDVDDVEQRTLAAVSLKLSTFESRARFTTWLHTIASNEARMLIRSRSRRHESTTFDGEVPEAPFLARLSTLLGNRDMVEKALAALPPAQRQVLTLREVDGLDYHEISEQLGVPVGTVRSRLSRAREALASSLREALA